MAQKNASPTKRQADTLKRHGLNPLLWTVLKELNHKLIVLQRLTGEVKTIDKQAKEHVVVETLSPDPDSQYRLRPCGCRGEPVYQKLSDGSWRVCCEGCGAVCDPYTVRHDAQVYWNEKMAAMPTRKGGAVV